VPHVILLGAGFVGSTVRILLEEHATVDVFDLPTHPVLAERGPEATALLRDAIGSTGATAVVNTSGLLRGTEEIMTTANVSWPTWLVREVVAGTGVRFVHLGSAAEYGDPGSGDPIPETAVPHPSGLYGETKWAGSAAVLAARESGLDAVVARGFNLVGPHLAPVSPLHQFLTDVTALPPEGGVVELWDPSTVRDFILLDDLALGVARLALAPVVPDIVNLCSGIGVSFAAIVEAMAARQGKSVEIRSLDRRGIPVVIGDPSRLASVCDVHPRMSAGLIAERSGT